MRLVWVLGAMFLSASAGCDDAASSRCREIPELCDDGEAGAFCDGDEDCQGTCCTDNANCGGGMCTFSCDRDEDCPDIMGCEHGVCFYLCDSDDDCADGQSCEHDNTICEYP